MSFKSGSAPQAASSVNILARRYCVSCFVFFCLLLLWFFFVVVALFCFFVVWSLNTIHYYKHSFQDLPSKALGIVILVVSFTPVTLWSPISDILKMTSS